jgi:hypothetical protein
MFICMTRPQKRKYEKIDQAEIDLVVQCNDSHEFYERYREAFPTRKKGIDSISKIWKRRHEFVKKHEEASLPAEPGVSVSHELGVLISAQNKILAELSVVMKEQLKVSREILARFPKQRLMLEEHPIRPGEPKIPDQKEPQKKTSTEKPAAEIMVGS